MRSFTPSIAFFAALIGLPGCEPGNPTGAGGAPPDSVPAVARAKVVFPADLQADDATVNAMLNDAMSACVDGDYDAFRRLWSAKDDPVPRERFVNHFKTVESMIVRALEADPDPQRQAYAVCVEITFDKEKLPPQHELQADPRRLVVLLIVREQDQWRFAKAPKAVRTWMSEKIGEADVPDDDLLGRGDRESQR